MTGEYDEASVRLVNARRWCGSSCHSARWPWGHDTFWMQDSFCVKALSLKKTKTHTHMSTHTQQSLSIVLEVLSKGYLCLELRNTFHLFSVLSSVMFAPKNVDMFIQTVIISVCLILITNSLCHVFGIISCSTPCCEVHSHRVHSFSSH